LIRFVDESEAIPASQKPHLAAQMPAGFLESDKPASRWSPVYRSIVEQGYGQWLAFLDRKGVLDSTCTPGDRVTDARLREFMAECLTSAPRGQIEGFS
jgi:hypothetical protein